MKSSTLLLLSALTALTSSACRPETPRPGDVCLELSGTSQTNDIGCQDQVCVAATQTVKKDVNASGQGFVCERCTGIPTAMISVDENQYWATLKYTSSELDIEFHFDNRVTLDYSTENFEKYAYIAHGTHKTSVGNSRFFAEPFEVLAYAGGKLHVRLRPKVASLAFQTLGAPQFCVIGGVPVPCPVQTCVYGEEHLDWTPVLPNEPYYELAIDLNLPVTMTPW